MDEFEDHRRVLFGIAYRMLASVSDAEDIVQDAYLRYAVTPRESIQSPRAFLATIVTRLCLNYLQSARVQRETYTGPWLPEPLVGSDTGAAGCLRSQDQLRLRHHQRKPWPDPARGRQTDRRYDLRIRRRSHPRPAPMSAAENVRCHELGRPNFSSPILTN